MKLNNPFPGLRPFQDDESPLFFGRENHTKEILRKLNIYRFVSIVGNSGSGKSSLVRAGVLPQIVNHKETKWQVCAMRPGKDPVRELSEALFSEKLFGVANETERQKQVESNEIILRKNSLGLVQTVRQYVTEDKRLLILVDQFEELFRFNKLNASNSDENLASHFIDLLLAAAGQKDVNIYIIMTIRSDFLGDCEQFMGLPEAINDGQFLIPRMNRDEIQTSITGPVNYVGGKISPRLVQKLLNELGNNPDQLPILQHVLMQTWKVYENNYKEGQPMDIEHYEATGGMAKSLSNHAEEAYSELKTDQKKNLAETIFKSITLKGGDNRGIRRPTQISKIADISGASADEIIEVVNVFRSGDRGFLMPQASVVLNGNSILDISHESLMRVWERLTNWVDEEAESAELYARISESALLYQKEMAGLWRDPDLQIALDWIDKNNPTNAWADQYNTHFTISMRFIEASLTDKEFLMAEKTRRKKLVNVVLVSFLFLLSGLSIWAFTERNSSMKNAESAIAQTQIAKKQKIIAEEQKNIAEKSLSKAELEEKKAHEQEMEALKQGKIALLMAQEAKLEKLKAERSSISANDARKAAEVDRKIAELQKTISDSLRQTAEISQKNANRLRILSVAQNLAIKSKLADNTTYNESVKSLLAIQAYKFNKNQNGKNMDPEIFGALYSAIKSTRENNTYVFMHHSDVVKSIWFNPVSDLLASASSDGTLCVSDLGGRVKTKQCSKVMPLILDNVVYHTSGNKIATSCDNKSILIFDAKNVSDPEKEIKGLHPQEITALAWHQEDLISACFDMNIRLINIDNSKILFSYSIESRPISMAMDHVKRELFIGCENGTIYRLELKADSKPMVFKSKLNGRITCLNLNKTGNLLAYGSSEGNCGILTIQNPEKGEIVLRGHKAAVTDVRFSPKTNQVASSCLDGNVRLWNADVPDEPPIVFSDHDSWVMEVSFNSSGNLLASSGKDKTIRLYLINPSDMVVELEKTLKRNFTKAEWISFMGEDIPYEKTVGL